MYVSEPANAEYILKHGGIQQLILHLKHKNNEIVTNIITTLIFLYNEQTKSEINNTNVVETIKTFAHSEDQRLANISKLFLKDVCCIE